MDQLFKQSDFVDFMSMQCREKELLDYERRIRALQAAKATLASSPVYALSKSQRRAARLCQAYDWSEEEVAQMIEVFLKQNPGGENGRNNSAIASGVSRLGQALFLG